MWTKGQDKSKIEMLSPTRQITITNGDQMTIINTESGQKTVQDLKKLRDKSGALAGGQSGGQMSLEKISEFFYLSVRKLDPATAGSVDTYVITGVPKQQNRFMGKMEIYVDGDKWLPVKVLMYDTKGKVMSQSEIEYAEVSGIMVPAKNVSKVTTPMGKMDIEMTFENVKVNKGISDKEFEVK
jgi:outer membrane lipoprotein-sorting protein